MSDEPNANGGEEFLAMFGEWLCSEDGRRLKRPMSAKEIIATDPTGSFAKAMEGLILKAAADPDGDLAAYLRWRGFMAPRIWRIKDDGQAGTRGTEGWLK